jgi:hypothetical protein
MFVSVEAVFDLSEFEPKLGPRVALDEPAAHAAVLRPLTNFKAAKVNPSWQVL